MQQLIKEIHHPLSEEACRSIGARRIEKTFSDVYFVNGVRNLVQEVLNKCTGTCKRMKSISVVPPPPIPIRSSNVMERMQVDLIEMYGRKSPFFSQANHKYRLVMSVVDCFSKYCWLFPLETKHAKNVAERLCCLFKHFGCPRMLQSDNGKEFVANILKEICSRLNIKMVHGRPYHPQSQGVVENLNKRVKKSLASLLLKFSAKQQSSMWPWLLDEAAQLLNNTYNGAIKDIPFRIFFGRDSGQFGVNNTSDLFCIRASDSEMLSSLGKSTSAADSDDNDGKAWSSIEFEEQDLQGLSDSVRENIPVSSDTTVSEVNSTVPAFLDLCITRDQLSKNVAESLEHSGIRNHIAYTRKVKCSIFKPGQEVLFAHPHQVGLVTVPNVKGKIVRKLHGDYYQVEALGTESKQQLALHACTLAPYGSTSKDANDQCANDHDSDNPVTFASAMRDCAEFQRHKFFSKQAVCAVQDNETPSMINSAISFMNVCGLIIQEPQTCVAWDPNTLMEVHALSLDLDLIANQTSNQNLQQCCRKAVEMLHNLLAVCKYQYYLSGITA